MGRKPNQVILQYFNRGSKLDDASNRYQHTCKACGEHFPKGRIEGLINHLTKKCPSLSYPQKQEIVIQFYDLSETALHPANGGNKIENSRPINLPFSPNKQNFNSLNILAEASRRVGANDPPKDGVFATFESQNGSQIPLDPSLDIDSFTQTYLNDEDSLTANANAAASAAMSSPFNYIPSEPTIASHDNVHDLSQSVSEAITSQGPELRSIAASASDILPLGPDLDMPHHSEALFTDAVPRNILEEQQERAQEGERRALAEDQAERPVEPTVGSSDPGSALRPVAKSNEAHFVSESGTSLRSPKPKVRGKFSPNRRQEVREMRQRGACLRCRMLKKTCSNGNPCQACASIETPRIWKNPCIRTKLVNEFSLYFVGLHTTLTYREITQLKQETVAQESGGSIDVYHLDESPTGVSLKATRIMGTALFAEAVDPHAGTLSEDMRSTECFIVASDNDDISKKMGMYLRNEKDRFLEQDGNPFVKTTLKMAKTLADQKSDSLLANILWLWTCTSLLIDERLQWQSIVSETTEAPSEYEAPEMISLPSKVSPKSNLLINAQLRVGVEICGKTLAKTILGDLERRLLQRQQDRQFDTFLAVILVLNCFERICWLFKAHYSKQPDKWPFPQSAEEFVREGERFADIIDLLVDMRSLPPRTFFDPVKNTLVPLGNQDESVRAWFDEISITQEYLQFNSERPFDGADFHSMDGRFFARLLQPDTERPPKGDTATQGNDAH